MLKSLRSTFAALAPHRGTVARIGIPVRDRTRFDERAPAGWQPTVYGEYYARSPEVYAAIRLRAEAVSRPALVVYARSASRTGRDQLVPVGPDHPVQRLLDHANEWWSTPGLMAATETYLCLWGSAFWYLERDAGGTVQAIWPLRPDRVRPVRDATRYVAGFIYSPPGEPQRETPLLPEDVVWFRYFNPLDDHAGLSPIAPARLTADMGMDALRFNREFFRNGAHPQDIVFQAKTPLSDEQVDAFYARLDQRYSGHNVHRPIVTGNSWEVRRLGLDQRDMEWLAGLRWSLETIARAYGVPLPLLEDFSHATLNNVREARRLFWEKTVVPELMMVQGVLNNALLPRLGLRRPSELSIAFDLSIIEGLNESESERTKRQVELVRTGILTINEARRERGLPPVPWGDAGPAGA